MKRFALLVQLAGAALIVAGVAAFSLPIALITAGLLLIVVGEVHG